MGVPKPPTQLSPAARKLWRSVTEQWALDDYGYAILTEALEAYDLKVKAQESVEKDGVLVPGASGGLVANPAVRVVRDARAAYLKALRQLGLDLEPPSHKIGRPGGR